MSEKPRLLRVSMDEKEAMVTAFAILGQLDTESSIREHLLNQADLSDESYEAMMTTFGEILEVTEGEFRTMTEDEQDEFLKEE